MEKPRLSPSEIVARRERDERDREFARQQHDIGVQGPLAERAVGFAVRYERRKLAKMRARVQDFLHTASPEQVEALHRFFGANPSEVVVNG